MNKEDYLCKLYYYYGKQYTNFELQSQKKDGFMSKRHNYLDANGTKFIDYANARTLLYNEIVIDMDPDKDEEQEHFENRILRAIAHMKSSSFVWGAFSSNRGVHIHIFHNPMFFMSDEKRKEIRTKLIKLLGGDLHKVSDRVTISLEFAEHWKSGKIKEYITGNLFEVENGIR